MQSDHPLNTLFNVETLPAKGVTVELRPDETARQALATMNDLIAVEDFFADVTLRRWHRDGVRITGSIVADIVQTCSVTTDPVSQHLETDIDAIYLPETSRLADKFKTPNADNEFVIDPEGDDAPELFALPFLDVGKAVGEFFTMAIDPYPRAPGCDEKVAFSTDSDDQDEKPVSPFASLKTLAQKDED